MVALRLHGPDEAGDEGAGRHADGLHAQLVDQARNDDLLTLAETFVAGARHARGVHHLQRAGEEPGVLHLGARLEAGGGGARAERGDRDAAAAQLLGERLREREDVGLGGVVDGHQRPGLEGGRRGDVEDAAPAAGEHPRQESLGQVREGYDIELDLLQLAREVRFGEGPEGGEAGVVDQRVDGHSGTLQLLEDLVRRAGPGEVLGEDPHGDAMPVPQLAGQLLQFPRAPRHQHQVVAPGRESAGQLPTDAARGAGDERRLPRCHGADSSRLAPIPLFRRPFPCGYSRTNGVMRIFFRHDVLSPAAEPRSMNCLPISWTQDSLLPWPAKGTTTWTAWVSQRAALAANAGGVTGSRSPLMSSTGTPERIASRCPGSMSARGQTSQAAICWR